jgi:hypothetical protein
VKEIKDGTKWTNSHWKEFPTPGGDNRPILLVDFDHTITTKCLACLDYDKNEVQDGARDALKLLSRWYRIIVFTGNYNYIDPKAKLMKTAEQIEQWLRVHDIPFEQVLQIKPPACFIIDDRAIHHTSWSDTLGEIKRRQSQ